MSLANMLLQMIAIPSKLMNAKPWPSSHKAWCILPSKLEPLLQHDDFIRRVGQNRTNMHTVCDRSNIQCFPCHTFRIYTVHIWFWPTLFIRGFDESYQKVPLTWGASPPQKCRSHNRVGVIEFMSCTHTRTHTHNTQCRLLEEHLHHLNASHDCVGVIKFYVTHTHKHTHTHAHTHTHTHTHNTHSAAYLRSISTT